MSRAKEEAAGSLCPQHRSDSVTAHSGCWVDRELSPPEEMQKQGAQVRGCCVPGDMTEAWGVIVKVNSGYTLRSEQGLASSVLCVREKAQQDLAAGPQMLR